ncbi:MAG: HEAT repeat domain-containing protein, partial [Longimicrobiales bacterium]|nr:HEAT repeat domain-containing protein [Longimicrobiales bacterium]
EALVEMGPVGRKIIEEMAEDENRFLVRNAVAILGDTGGDRAVELVTSALANPDARVRKEALRSLAKLGDEDSGELVLGLLEDPDQEVRVAAAVAAGELHVERALRSIIKMLDSTSDPDEAIPLIRALGHLGDPGAVASIEKHVVPKLFSRPRTDVRIVGYRALHQIGTPHARRLLNQAMDDKDPEVKAAVKEILGMR